MTSAKRQRSGPGLRQTMSDLHTWVGLLLGWFLYAMFLTGTIAYFKDELSQWMRPELPMQAVVPDQAVVAQRVADALGTVAAGGSQWAIRLPDARNNSVYVFWRQPARTPGRRGGGFGEGHFDPATGQQVDARATQGGDFFLRFHFQFHYLSPFWGRWLAGVAAMFMLVAIISGVITHKKIFTDFFTFRWGKGQRSWLDAHNLLSVFGLPFHLMITYTGLITLMAMYMPWGQDVAIKTPAERAHLRAELSAFLEPSKPSGQAVPLASIEEMVRQAQQRWGQDGVGRVTITHPGDANARVAVARGEFRRVSMSPQTMLFEGTTGKLLEVRDQVGNAAETRGVMYGLHLGRFSDTITRWLYFIVSLAGTAMVGTGLVMWTVKRRQKLPNPDRPHVGFWLVERLNIAAIAGLSLGCAALLWANRLLPAELPRRASQEIDVLFVVWGLALAWTLLRPARKAWVELLWAAAVALALVPVVNALSTDRALWHSIAAGDWIFITTDLLCLAFAALHAWLAIRTHRHRPRLRASGNTRKDDKARPEAQSAPAGDGEPA